MPKSDTWPGGTAMETMGEMDSAESCDSVVSFNSCFSDDSMQYLSSEEKACLMFLEATIESLDTEDDSGLSNDEAESFPAPGNVAAKAVCLSASMDQNKQNEIPKLYVDDPRIFGSTEHNQILNYLVPTPFVLANGNPHPPPKPGMAASKEKLPTKDESVQKSDQRGSSVASEVNVVMIPPPFPDKSSNGRDKGVQNDRSPRGPLTYEGLVQLRQKVSSRNAKQLSAFQDKDGSQVSQNIQLKENQSSKNCPPAVAPKPKKIPSHVAVLNHNANTSANPDSTVHCLSTSPGRRGLMKSEKVRLEALSKLGLLKNNQSDPNTSTKGYPAEMNISRLSQPSSGSAPDLSQSWRLRPAVFGNQELRNQPRQSNNLLHHRSMTDLTAVPSQAPCAKPEGSKAATLERSGMGLGSSMSSHTFPDYQSSDGSFSQKHLQCSTTVNKNNPGSIQTSTNPLSNGKTQVIQASIPPPLPQKPLPAPGSNVLMVPNMGEERRLALRKLGLLKN